MDKVLKTKSRDVQVEVKPVRVPYTKGKIQGVEETTQTYYVLKNGYRMTLNQMKSEIINEKPTNTWNSLVKSSSRKKIVEYFIEHLEDNFISLFPEL